MEIFYPLPKPIVWLFIFLSHNMFFPLLWSIYSSNSNSNYFYTWCREKKTILLLLRLRCINHHNHKYTYVIIIMRGISFVANKCHYDYDFQLMNVIMIRASPNTVGPRSSRAVQQCLSIHPCKLNITWHTFIILIKI